MDNLGPPSQRDLEDEIRVVIDIDHRSRRWQLTAYFYLATILNVTKYDCPNEIAKALRAEQAEKKV